MTDPQYLYRYATYADVVLLEKYRVRKITRCGYWIDRHPDDYQFGKKRFVLKDSFKKFACATLDDAKVSFYARQKRRLAILNRQIEDVTAAVEAMKAGRVSDYNSSRYLELY